MTIMYKLLLGLGCQAISRVKNQDVDPSEMPFLCEGQGRTISQELDFGFPWREPRERERKRERDF
jgi:hypothetical protein